MSGHAQKPLFCQSDWCYTPAEKDGGALVLRAILSFAVSSRFLPVHAPIPRLSLLKQTRRPQPRLWVNRQDAFRLPVLDSENLLLKTRNCF
jgi:hypothetical protein